MTLFYCDDARHLVCKPYSIENLHQMAEELNIKRCWFHNSKGFRSKLIIFLAQIRAIELNNAHYDIPKRRIEEITAKCTMISTRELLDIIKNPT